MVGNIEALEPSSTPEISSLPQGTVQQELFQLREEIKKVGDKTTRLNIKPLKGLRSELDQLALDELDAVKEVIEATNTRNAWSYSQLLFSLASAAASIIGGAYLVAMADNDPEGQALGTKFVATGAISLANILMEHLGGWKALSKLVSFGNETIEYYTGFLPYVVSIFTITYTAYNMISVPLDHQSWMKWITGVLSSIDAVIRVGTIYTNVKKGFADIKLLDIQGKSTVATKKIEPITRRGEYLAERTNTAASQMKKTLQNFNKVNTAVMAN